MSDSGSITHWVSALRQKDSLAAYNLWQSFRKRLEEIARRELGRAPFSGSFDEQDVALSAFSTFCQQVQSGHFSKLGDRQELWWLLAVITKRKAGDRIKYERAARRRRPKEAEGDGQVSSMPAGESNPEDLVAMRDQCEHLLELLGDDELRFIAILKLEGRGNDEIGRRLSRTRQTIQRKLNLIRSIWRQELEG
jgi:DNA-directed RNA polymerase specialized sigma24 family protein